MVAKQYTHLGVGLYSYSDAAKLLHVPVSRIKSWTDAERGILARSLPSEEKTLTFAELMELHFIALFRKEGVSLPAIRRASKAAAKKYDTTHPFSVERFDTDGKTVFATLISEEKDSTLVEDLQHGQYVFDSIVRPFFKNLEYDSMEVARFWPMSKRGRVVLDPSRKFGRPIDNETSVTTRAIADAVEANPGQDAATVADWLGIPVAAVKAAVEFERSIAA